MKIGNKPSSALMLTGQVTDDAYMRQLIWISLHQIMACRLVGVKSLVDPLMIDFRQWLCAKQAINHYLNQSPTSVAHICVPWHWVKEDIIASRNGLSSIRRQAITRTIYGSSYTLTTERYLNTLRPRQTKWPPFRRRYFQTHFLE